MQSDIFGENTLNELRKSFAMAEISLENSLSARVSPMMELKSLGDLLSKAGFRDIVTDLISQSALPFYSWFIFLICAEWARNQCAAKNVPRVFYEGALTIA